MGVDVGAASGSGGGDLESTCENVYTDMQEEREGGVQTDRRVRMAVKVAWHHELAYVYSLFSLLPVVRSRIFISQFDGVGAHVGYISLRSIRLYIYTCTYRKKSDKKNMLFFPLFSNTRIKKNCTPRIC